MIEIPSDLHPQCLPLVWLLGRWEGAGVGDYPTIEGFRFGQEMSFGYVPDKTFLTYESRSWLLDEDGQLVRPLARETGYWRPQPDGEVEVLLAHPTGFVEIYLGEVGEAKVGKMPVGAYELAGTGTGDGLLGRDFLDQFKMTVDAAKGEVTLAPK